MKNRIFRLLVCLVLVCVILVNCSPIRAEATGVEALYLSTVFVNPTIAVTAVLFGLGVIATAAATAVFTKLVDDITVDMVDKGLISSQGVDMYRADADGAATYLVNQELVEAVRDYLWENDVFVSEPFADGSQTLGGVSLSFNEVFDSSKYSNYLLFSYCDSSDRLMYYRLFYNDSPFTYTYTGSCISTSSCYCVFYTVSQSKWSSPSYTSHIINASSGWSFELIGASPSFGGEGIIDGTISVSDGFTAGEIAGQNQSFSEGYSEWASGARSLPTLRDGVQTDAMSAYIALGMGMTQEETMAMTQAAVQSGVGTYEGTGTGTDAVTATGLKGWLDTIRLTLVSGFSDLVDGLLSGISSLFVPSAEAMAAQQDKWTTLLSDRFGAVYDSVALIDNIAGAFTLGATQTQIRFPLITIPFGDVSWEFGGWMVDVVPDGFQVLVDALKVGIDILCTLAFVNAMKYRFDRVLEGRG